MKTKIGLLSSALTLACLAAATGAWAQGARAAGQGRRGAGGERPCLKEVQALCPGMTRGDHKLGPCVRQNLDKLSQTCQSKIRSAFERFRGGAGVKGAQEAPADSGAKGGSVPAAGGGGSADQPQE